MDTLKLFKTKLKKEWYIQGFNGYPIFLSPAAISGILMEKSLGFGYTIYLYNYHSGYGEMHYSVADLKRIWRVISRKLAKNKHYLRLMKKRHEKIVNKYKRLFKAIDKLDLEKVTREELLVLFKASIEALTGVVSISHMIEPIGLEMDKILKKALLKEIRDKTKLNKYFSLLSTPSKGSFIAKEEEALRRIGSTSPKERKEKLMSHLKKYDWVQNSYAGPKKITIRALEKRLRLQKGAEKYDTAVKTKKNRLIKKLGLSKKTRELIEIIDFSTIWQDERKENILITINYIGRISQEIARRTKVPVKEMYYMDVYDVKRMKSIDDVISLRKELQTRTKGVFIIHEKEKEYAITGKLYKKLLQYQKTLSKHSAQTEDALHGSIANTGTAIGRAVICRGIASIAKVKQGDILVASMTRPEYMPALKKAAAIVTDEGGITCHAAIVSRELKIPAIIGTKVGTKVLKDGMMIEVRANHGIVNILN